MMRYHLNLKSAITNRRVTLAILLVAAICCNTLKIYAELPPKSYLLPIGNEQTPGGPKIKHYDPSPMGNVMPDEWENYSSDYRIWDSNSTASIGDGSGTWVQGKVSNDNNWLNTYPHPPLNAIACQFPPIIESSNSVAMVVYKKEELGLNGIAATLRQLRLNALYARENNNPYWTGFLFMSFSGNNNNRFTWDLTEWGGNNAEGYLPYNVANEIGLYFQETIQTGDFISQIGDPTPVQIYIKNGAEFTERGEQDVDKFFNPINGWVKVYDGYYDYLDEEQWDSYTPYAKVASTYKQDQQDGYPWGVVEPWGEDATTGFFDRNMTYFYTYSTDEASQTKGFNVTIPFEQKFNYEGGDITVVFVNPSESRGFKSDVWRGRIGEVFEAGAILRPNNPIDNPTTYRFRCYAVQDTDAVVNNDYLGPKFSIGSQVFPTYTSTDLINRPYPRFGLQFSYADLLGWSYDTIVAANGPLADDPTDYRGDTKYHVTGFNANKLTYSVPLTDLFLRREEGLSDGLGSVRPRIGLDIEVQSLVTDNFANGADFKNSEQVLWNADRTPNDTQWVVGEFTIFADSSKFPLDLKRINFNTGTTSETLSPKVVLYRDNSTNGQGDMTTSDKLLEMVVADNAEHAFNFTNDNLKVTLKPGENRFFFVFEIEKAKAKCDENMEVQLTNFVLGNRERFDSDKEYEVEVGTAASKSIAFNPVDIINTTNDSRYRQVCISDENLNDLTLNAGQVVGRYNSFVWEASYNNGEYVPLAGASAEATEITVPATAGITSVRFRVLYPEEGCLATNDNVVWTIAYETNIEAVNFEYTGKLPHTSAGLIDRIYQGEFLEFRAFATHSDLTIPVYRWEVSSDRVTWTAVGSQQILDYVVPLGTYGQQWLRVTATPDPTLCVCTKAITSVQEFTFTVIPQEIGFTFSENLPAYQSICQGTTLLLSVAYEGTVDPAGCYWTKDGQRLATSDREITISGNANGWGTYQYVARAWTFDPENDVEPGWRLVYSKPCVVSAIAPLKIYTKAAQNNYALPGIPVGLLFETSKIKVNSPDEGYQWYKHTAGGEVRLQDNDVYRYGSTSNQLTLVPPEGTSSVMAKDVYTFNGEYYFLEIKTACNTIRSDRIYVLPSEGLKFTKEVVDAVVCKMGDVATWEVEANEGNEIENVNYQWYVGGRKVSNGNGISGATTSVLAIDPITAPDTKVFCEVTAEILGIPVMIRSITVGVVIATLKNFVVSNAIDNTALTLDLKWETNNFKSTHTVNVTLNDSAWVEEVQPASAFKVQTMRLTIPVDDRFAALVADSPDNLNVLVEVKDECDNVLNHRATVSLAGLDIKTIVPAAIEDNMGVTGLDILPNPVNDIVTVGFTSEPDVLTTIDLCDLSGRAIITLYNGVSQAGYNKLNFNLANLRITPGTYIIRISGGEQGMRSRQFVFAK